MIENEKWIRREKIKDTQLQGSSGLSKSTHLWYEFENVLLVFIQEIGRGRGKRKYNNEEEKLEKLNGMLG